MNAGKQDRGVADRLTRMSADRVEKIARDIAGSLSGRPLPGLYPTAGKVLKACAKFTAGKAQPRDHDLAVFVARVMKENPGIAREGMGWLLLCFTLPTYRQTDGRHDGFARYLAREERRAFERAPDGLSRPFKPFAHDREKSRGWER